MKLGNHPVKQAKVYMHIESFNRESTNSHLKQKVSLVDDGYGGKLHLLFNKFYSINISDPDLTSGDGIYSLYLGNYINDPGTYRIYVTVEDNNNSAHISTLDNRGIYRCCGSDVSIQEDKRKYTGIFRRRIEGLL